MDRRVVGVLATFILMAGQAAAEGLPPQSRIRGPEPVGPRWTGFYIGAGAGVGAASYDISGTKTGTRTKTGTQTKTGTRTVEGQCKKWQRICISGCDCDYVCIKRYTHTEEYQYTEQYEYEEEYSESFKDSGTTDVGAFGIVSVGYDKVLKQGWVGGVFADYDFGSGISGDVSVGGVQTSLDHNHSWAVGARLGYLVTPSTLLYGTAGYTQAQVELNGFGSQTFGGYFVGAGVETFLRQSWTVRLEYRYSDFGEERIVDTASMTADLDLAMHTARVVLTYRLDQD
jgi:opacity protein-like surface antigen